MPNFETRWRLGLDHFYNQPLNDNKYNANAGKLVRKMSLVNAFRYSTFIYGTTGPNAFHSGGIGSHPAIRAIHVMNTRVKKYGEDNGVNAQKAARVLQRLFFNIRLRRSVYDPGSRAKQYLHNGYQMMDMYYGMHGHNANTFWMKRDNTIAEFVHYVMGYHMEGIDFRPDEPGWKTYQNAFPGASKKPGWELSEDARLRYGQSATKEISKIIREGIKTFGGTLIFEGKDVYGDSVFNSQATPRDTDVEARELFTYFGRARLSANVPYGNGRLEYHWGGRPTIPTRAHFLSNWRYAAKKNGVAPTHTKANREGDDGYIENWTTFLKLAMEKNPAGFLPIWSNFENFPGNRPSSKGVAGMMETIDHLCKNP